MSITCSCMTASRTFTLTRPILGASLPRLAASPRVPRFVPQTLARRMQSTSSATLAPSTASLNSQPSGSSKPILSTDPSQRSSPKAKKPSPYRLLTPTQRDELLPPLQAHGWSVQPLPLSSQATQSPAVDKAQQQEELVGSFRFTHSKGKAAAQAAWRDTLRFVATAGEIIEAEDVSYTTFISLTAAPSNNHNHTFRLRSRLYRSDPDPHACSSTIRSRRRETIPKSHTERHDTCISHFCCL